MKASNLTIEQMIQEANSAWDAKKESVLNETFQMKGFNGEAYSITVNSVDEKGFCSCVEAGKEEKGSIRVSIDFVLKGKKI